MLIFSISIALSHFNAKYPTTKCVSAYLENDFPLQKQISKYCISKDIWIFKENSVNKLYERLEHKIINLLH